MIHITLAIELTCWMQSHVTKERSSWCSFQTECKQSNVSAWLCWGSIPFLYWTWVENGNFWAFWWRSNTYYLLYLPILCIWKRMFNSISISTMEFALRLRLWDIDISVQISMLTLKNLGGILAPEFDIEFKIGLCIWSWICCKPAFGMWKMDLNLSSNLKLSPKLGLTLYCKWNWN